MIFLKWSLNTHFFVRKSSQNAGFWAPITKKIYIEPITRKLNLQSSGITRIILFFIPKFRFNDYNIGNGVMQPKRFTEIIHKRIM